MARQFLCIYATLSLFSINPPDVHGRTLVGYIVHFGNNPGTYVPLSRNRHDDDDYQASSPYDRPVNPFGASGYSLQPAGPPYLSYTAPAPYYNPTLHPEKYTKPQTYGPYDERPFPNNPPPIRPYIPLPSAYYKPAAAAYLPPIGTNVYNKPPDSYGPSIPAYNPGGAVPSNSYIPSAVFPPGPVNPYGGAYNNPPVSANSYSQPVAVPPPSNFPVTGNYNSAVIGPVSNGYAPSGTAPVVPGTVPYSYQPGSAVAGPVPAAVPAPAFVPANIVVNQGQPVSATYVPAASVVNPPPVAPAAVNTYQAVPVSNVSYSNPSGSNSYVPVAVPPVSAAVPTNQNPPFVPANIVVNQAGQPISATYIPSASIANSPPASVPGVNNYNQAGSVANVPPVGTPVYGNSPAGVGNVYTGVPSSVTAYAGLPGAAPVYANPPPSGAVPVIATVGNPYAATSPPGTPPAAVSPGMYNTPTGSVSNIPPGAIPVYATPPAQLPPANSVYNSPSQSIPASYVTSTAVSGINSPATGYNNPIVPITNAPPVGTQVYSTLPTVIPATSGYGKPAGSSAYSQPVASVPNPTYAKPPALIPFKIVYNPKGQPVSASYVPSPALSAIGDYPAGFPEPATNPLGAVQSGYGLPAATYSNPSGIVSNPSMSPASGAYQGIIPATGPGILAEEDYDEEEDINLVTPTPVPIGGSLPGYLKPSRLVFHGELKFD